MGLIISRSIRRNRLHLVTSHPFGSVEGDIRFTKQLFNAPLYPGDHSGSTGTYGDYRTHRGVLVLND
jgi:hypothetical protein